MDQLCIRSDKPQAHTRQYTFGQAAQINHPATVIKTLQRRMITAQKILLIFVVIFDDQKIPFPRTRQQFKPTVQRHGHARRGLMAGGAKQHLATFQLLIDHQPLAVDTQRFQLTSPQAKDVARIHIPRLFQPHHQPRPPQQLRQHVQRVLRANGDHHLLRRHADAALGQHTLHDLFDQQRVVEHHLIVHPTAHVRAGTGDTCAVTPTRSRLLVCLDLPIDKRIAVLAPVARFNNGPQSRRTALQTRFPVGCMVGALEDFLRRGFEADVELLAQVFFVDEEAAPVRWNQITILNQLLVNQHHGIARHLEQLAQRARRGHRFTGRHGAIQDRAEQIFTQLLL